MLFLILGMGLLPAARGLYGQSDPEWYKTYLAGLDKARVKDHKGAIVLLRRAISQHQTSATSPRYTPYFYAGLCYDASGDKDSAADFYTQEDKQEAIRAFPDDYKILQENFDRIQSGEFGVIVIDRTKAGNNGQEQSQPKPVETVKNDPPAAKQASSSAGKPAVIPQTSVTKPPADASSTAAAQPPKPDPTCDLKRCLAPFLRGNYPVALKEAGPIIQKNCPDRKAALFIAGASQYSLFLLSGETDVKAKAEAERLFKACAGYQPPGQWVSPSVLSYYQQVSSRKP